MKKLNLLLLSVLLMFITNSIFGQNLTAFESKMKACGMSAIIPTGFVENKIVANTEMEYEYALKYPDKNFEVRYAVVPIKYKVYPNDSTRNAMETKASARNSSYDKNLKSLLYTITGGVDYEFKVFDKNSVKDEFNADWGAITLVELKSTFGKGYKYCMVVAIHKDDVADAYYFYLSNAQESFPENMKPLFHSLRFD